MCYIQSSFAVGQEVWEWLAWWLRCQCTNPKQIRGAWGVCEDTWGKMAWSTIILSHWSYKKHALLKAYATKPWPHYHRMQTFMSGTQPQGTHTFDPASSSSQSAMQMLDSINTEEEGAEDQVNSLPDPSISTTSPLIPPDLDTFLTSSIIASLLPPHSGPSSSSGHTNPPPSSSLPPTVYSWPTQQPDISMGSMQSMTTGSDAGSAGQHQKRKYDARLASSMQPCSSKQLSMSKTNDLNPVIITTALNSTLNRMVNVMERTLDATAAPSAPAPSTAPPPIINPSIKSSQRSLASMSLQKSLIRQSELYQASIAF